MARAWRIIKQKFATNAFDGEGTRLYGSRWSSPGTRIVFAAEYLSLATLEILVHLQKSDLFSSFVAYSIDFGDHHVSDLDSNLLPENWCDSPPPPEVQQVGDNWVQEQFSLVLRVPSAIISHEYNFLINPAHAEFSRLTISEPIQLDVDSRLFNHK